MDTGTNAHDADLIQIIDEPDTPEPSSTTEEAWKILVVDDDQQVHDSTKLALQGARILNRPLHLTHVHSAAEAEQQLAADAGYAVVLLDVVMESGDAGLTLVRAIRDKLGLKDVRIILRTGQPGYAPELEVIRDFDINDYRTKSELSRTRLLTSLTAALRSYEQICALNYSRRGLEKMVQASSELFDKHGLKNFAEGVLTQISGLIGAMPGGIVCARRGLPRTEHEDQQTLYVIGAMGCFAEHIDQPLNELGDPAIQHAIERAMEQKSSLFESDYSVLYLHSGDQEEAVYVASTRHIGSADQQLLEAFGSNISVGFANVYLFHQLNRLAFHDSLTNLPNRPGLIKLYDKLLDAGDKQLAIVLLDIDHFSDINDALGMDFGNEVLLSIARRLCARLPGSAHVGRFGGDVIGIICEEPALGIDTVLGLFETPFDIHGYALPLRVTAGEALSLAQREEDSGTQAFQRAGMALSRAKRYHRGGAQRYSDTLASDCRQRLELSSTLKQAIELDQLQLYYQPKVDLTTGKVVGAEALLRWITENGDMIPPSMFIPLAEQSGLILDIGEWVMRQAAAQLQRWQQQGLTDLHMAINVSAAQIRADAVVDPLQNALNDFSAPADKLEVEITETVVVEDFDKVTRCTQTLREQGIRIALDDFGTGFSSLSYLQRMQFDILKIDRTFIRDIGRAGQAEKITEMIVALGRLLDLNTVAEGIETEQQRETAAQWGCNVGQGYLFAKPMPAPEFEAWYAARSVDGTLP